MLCKITINARHSLLPEAKAVAWEEATVTPGIYRSDEEDFTNYLMITSEYMGKIKFVIIGRYTCGGPHIIVPPSDNWYLTNWPNHNFVPVTRVTIDQTATPS